MESLRKLFALDLLDNRYPALHGMRVVAILSVVQYHVTTIFTYETHLTMDRSWAMTSMTIFFGMDLFFILSGFLIGSILLRSVETAGFINVRRFWLRRAFRTFPAYYVVLTALVLLFGLTAAQRKHLPFEYAYLTNYVPLTRDGTVMLWGWSLALEEQFYLSVPLLFFGLSKLRSDRARLTLLGLFWISALVVRLVLFNWCAASCSPTCSSAGPSPSRAGWRNRCTAASSPCRAARACGCSSSPGCSAKNGCSPSASSGGAR